MKDTIRHFPTLDDIEAAHGWKQRYERYLPLSRYIFRPIGFRVTWLAVRLGATSEAVSWLSAAIGLLGLLGLVGEREAAVQAGMVLLMLFNLLDCVDGSIARTMRTENPYGRFLDSVCGGIIDLGFWAVVGVMVFRHPELLLWPAPFGYRPIFWLLLGGMTCLLCETLGFLEQRFDELLRPHWESGSKGEEAPAIDSATRQSRQSAWPLRLIIATNLRVRETHYTLLVVAYLTGTVDLLLGAYLLYYLSHSLLLLGVYCRRGRRVRQAYVTRK